MGANVRKIIMEDSNVNAKMVIMDQFVLMVSILNFIYFDEDILS